MIATPNNRKQIYLIFLTALLLTACGRGKKVDVSNIDVNIKVERFDNDFDKMRSGSMPKQAAILEGEYGIFYQDYIEQIIKAGRLTDTNYYGALRPMFEAPAYNDLKHDVDSVFPDLNKQDAELTDAFRHVKYYFPKQSIPKVYSFISGFEAQTAIGDSYFGIGLDQFLGANSRFYPALTTAFPHYISRFFTPDNITPRVVEGFLRNGMFPEKDDNSTLLSKMIYNGKIMYVMDQIIPDVPDSIKMQYTKKQMDWAKANEANIWGYFLDQNLLFESDYTKSKRFIDFAPFTPDIGQKNEAAPRLGIWVGWQIVKKYMDKNPNVTLQQLIDYTDSQKLMDEAKYKPANGNSN